MPIDARVLRVLAFVVWVSVVLAGCDKAGSRQDGDRQDAPAASRLAMPAKAQTDAPVADIKFEFKLDPRITRGMYMGDRWVSPPTYSRVGEGKTVVVEARAHGVDGQGRAVALAPRWASADPDMVTVSPAEGSQVEITVRRAGASSLRVTAGAIAKGLAITAKYEAGGIQVEIAQAK